MGYSRNGIGYGSLEDVVKHLASSHSQNQNLFLSDVRKLKENIL